MFKIVPRGFPREMWVIFAGDVITSLGMSMVFIFLSVYFNLVLGISLTVLGLIWMATDVSSFFSQIIGGALADHFGRKRLMELSLFLRGAIWVGIGFVDSTSTLAILIVVSGVVASIFWPASSAMVTDIIPHERRAEAFGLWRIGGNLGWGMGAMIGGVLAALSYKLVFIVGGISNIAFGFLVLMLLKETLPSKVDIDKVEQKAKGILNTFKDYRTVLYDRRFVLFVMIGVLIELLYSQSNTTLPVYAVGQNIINTRELGYIWALNGWSIVIFQMSITSYIEKRNISRMLAVGSLIYAMSFLVLLNATGFGMMLLFMSVFTFAEMIIAPIQMTFVANNAPEDMRGRYMGFFSLAWGLGGSTGPFIGGRIIDVYS
ncbi:MAG: MFS transporter, partial [Candidatus Methanofastidiosa archaeon]|nr:MFS transporter [Candidatus Methanofastidiosa archaeon]